MSLACCDYSQRVMKWLLTGSVASFFPLEPFALNTCFLFGFSSFILSLDFAMKGSFTFYLFSCSLSLFYTDGWSFLKYLGEKSTFSGRLIALRVDLVGMSFYED